MSGYGNGGTSTTFGAVVAKWQGGTENAEDLGALWIGMRHTMAKAFSWAFSKMKNYDTCPKRHYEVDLSKNFVDDTEQLKWGNEVHDALAAATLSAASLPSAGTGRDVIRAAPLPPTMKDYQKWIDGPGTGIVSGSGTLLIEQKLAVTRDFQPCSWFAGNVWFRGVCDVAAVDPTGSVARARDYKTGQLKHDSRQLMLMATCLFVHNPKLRRIMTEFVWLKDDCTTPEAFDRGSIMREWPPILAKVEEMQDAAVRMNYPPKPSRLCFKHCPVISCPFYGKRHGS